MNYKQRRKTIQRQLPGIGVDALLVTRLTNIRYLTGFTGTTAFLVMGDEPVLAVDFRYAEQVAREVGGCGSRYRRQRAANSGRQSSVFSRSAASGVSESKRRACGPHQYLDLTSTDGTCEWVPTNGVVERLRRNKDADEIAAIREAIRITDDAMGESSRFWSRA